MFGRSSDLNYIFVTRPFWIEMGIPKTLVLQKYKEYFGEKKQILEENQVAIKYLSEIITGLQNKFVKNLQTINPKNTIKDLYKILDEVWRFYSSQKEARYELSKLRTSASIGKTFASNRNIARNIIDAVNLWLENCVLYQDTLSVPYDSESFELNYELFIELYIYGSASKALSLISMSKKFGDRKLFYGVSVDIYREEPLEILKNHPIVYFSDLLAGNQDTIPITKYDLEHADETEFGKAFGYEYGLSFIYAMRGIATLQHTMLKKGKIAYTVVPKDCLVYWIEQYTRGRVNGNNFVDCFALTKGKVEKHIRNNDPIIWIMGSNKYRHEIRPLICLEDESIAISYTALEQAKNLWISIFLNGGMAYSTSKDRLTAAIEKRNKELSNKLVEALREKLRNHYTPGFDEIDVKYYRIFGEREYNYGDYDLVFYAPEKKELFLIEAKFFSDSLNNSGMISDYEKMFKKGGYYEHCRKRYDLVLAEPQRIKDFINVTGDVKLHCLFVSSKPLEIDFQDDDGVVTFPCLSIFDDYLEGKLLPEFGDVPVRPTHII